MSRVGKVIVVAGARVRSEEVLVARAGLRSLAAGVVAVVCLVTAACTQDTRDTQDTPSVPTGALWEGDHGESMRIEFDGGGVVEGLPYDTGSACDPTDFRTMSGEIAWEEIDDGELVLRQGDVEVAVSASRGPFAGAVVWRDVRVCPCGRESVEEAVEMSRGYGQ